MAQALELTRDIAMGRPEFAFAGPARRNAAAEAMRKGIGCVLKCQVVLDGKRTVWCQQHDEKDFRPRGARAFEPAALTAGESVRVVRFLMSIEPPGREVIRAVQGAAAWLNGPAKLTGLRFVDLRGQQYPKGRDRVIVQDSAAKPIWARLYYLGTLGGSRWKLVDPVRLNQPIFGDRDYKVYDALHKISHERRTGYSWYGHYPARLLAEDYPRWQRKWSPSHNAMEQTGRTPR